MNAIATTTDAPTVHYFDDIDEAYAGTQCDDDIRDGDVLVVESAQVVGFLDRAWPVSITESNGGEFHGLTTDPRTYADGRYAASAEIASRVAEELGFPLAHQR